MNVAPNTLFLRLSGPMQSWGTASRLQIRRTDAYPSKSGVLGMLLCAMGVAREEAPSRLEPLVALQMGVRVDRPGVLDWDYHTAGAGKGIRQAKGGIKYTAKTGKPETLLSRRQYILDASFLVALVGDPAVIGNAVTSLKDPVWSVCLGRKCCVPSEPVFAGTGTFANPEEALASVGWFTDRRSGEAKTVTLDTYVEYPAGSAPPTGATLVHDVPRTLVNPSHSPRWVVRGEVEVPMAHTPWYGAGRTGRTPVNYASAQWKTVRAERLAADFGLCVLCKSPAAEVHHVTYENVGAEKLEDLRSVCRNCHDACTQLEYGLDLRLHRIDPADPAQREAILNQVNRLLSDRRLGRRREIMEQSRALAVDFLADAPNAGRRAT